ncbi:MAG: hypothetical protein ABI137_00745 [Antricoccus sp.]
MKFAFADDDSSSCFPNVAQTNDTTLLANVVQSNDTRSRDLHYQQLPATEPSDLLRTELGSAWRSRSSSGSTPAHRPVLKASIQDRAARGAILREFVLLLLKHVQFLVILRRDWMVTRHRVLPIAGDHFKTAWPIFTYLSQAGKGLKPVKT